MCVSVCMCICVYVYMCVFDVITGRHNTGRIFAVNLLIYPYSPHCNPGIIRLFLLFMFPLAVPLQRVKSFIISKLLLLVILHKLSAILLKPCIMIQTGCVLTFYCHCIWYLMPNVMYVDTNLGQPR